VRDNIRAFVAAAAEAFPCLGPVYEFGSFIVDGQEQIGDLRSLFTGREYVGCDMREGPGVDRIEDLANLSLPDESVETIICVETLEHCFHVERAVGEMLRVLKPGGLLLISTPFQFHIHSYPDDYWRLTPSCLARLLADLPATMVGSQGVEAFPHTSFAIGCKGPVPSNFAAQADDFTRRFRAKLQVLAARETWKQWWKRRVVSRLRSRGERKNAEQYYDAQFVTTVSESRSSSQPPTHELRSVPRPSISTSAMSPGFK
jgi:SAM-dependent methyltransferase